jgi:hypothetical protein
MQLPRFRRVEALPGVVAAPKVDVSNLRPFRAHDAEHLARLHLPC